MTRSFDSISWPGIGPDQCNGYKFSYRDLPKRARSTLYKASKWAYIFLRGTGGPKGAWCNFGKGHLADGDRFLGAQNTLGARRKKFVASEAYNAVLDVFEDAKISARFLWGPGDRMLILSTNGDSYMRDFFYQKLGLFVPWLLLENPGPREPRALVIGSGRPPCLRLYIYGMN